MSRTKGSVLNAIFSVTSRQYTASEGDLFRQGTAQNCDVDSGGTCAYLALDRACGTSGISYCVIIDQQMLLSMRVE